MTIDEMRERRRELGYTYEMLSELSGVPITTIQKIFSGTTASPRRETILALEKVLKKTVKYSLDDLDDDSPYMLREKVYDLGKKDGEYTDDDFKDFPEGFLFELIDGKFYYLATPFTDHQTVVEEIYLQFREFIKKNKGKCLVRNLPTTIFYDKKNQLIPDLFVLCDRSKLGEENLTDSPDFVLEVLSPSTRQKDLTVKYSKYMQKGVRELWFVDLKKEKVITYFFEEGDIIGVYTFEDEIPVAIFGGKLKIDMKAVKKAVEDFYL